MVTRCPRGTGQPVLRAAADPIASAARPPFQHRAPTTIRRTSAIDEKTVASPALRARFWGAMATGLNLRRDGIRQLERSRPFGDGRRNQENQSTTRVLALLGSAPLLRAWERASKTRGARSRRRSIMTSRSVKRVLTGLCVTSGVFLLVRAGVSLGGDPAIVVRCGSDANLVDTSIQTTGTHCTSSSTPSSKIEKAVSKANDNLAKWAESSYVCQTCPEGQAGCQKNHGAGPPYEITDCTFSYAPGCQGNPLKTLVMATCTKTVTVTRECSMCKDGSEN